ncbi:MAG: hypothetical protein ACOYL6_18480 [Bacteriovoracaceae bacterium]
MKLLITLLAVLSLQSSMAAEKKCVFDDLKLQDLKTGLEGFKNITKDEKKVNLPKIFDSYKKQLGEWDKKDCKGAVLKTQFESLSDHGLYTFLFTNKDSCDGGNPYGLILGTKDQSPNKDKVIATITDGDINCL